MLASICRIFTIVFIILAAGSVLLIPASDAGFLGLEPGPLSAVFAIFLGLPWSLMLGDFSTADGVVWNLLLTTLGPALNVVILILLCRLTRGFAQDA